MPDLTPKLYLDRFELQTRLAPGLLVLLPVVAVIVDFGLKDLSVVSVGVGLLIWAGGPLLLADVVRRRGRRVERVLFARWGGMPSTSLLRLREPTDNPTRRDKWRGAVQKATGRDLLNKAAETRNPGRADELIESAVDDLRDLSRDDAEFPLLKQELRSYGFRRNLRGIRWPGALVSILCAVVAGLHAWHQSSLSMQAKGDLITLGLSLCVLTVWLGCTSARAVRAAALDYAFQLMQGAVQLERRNREMVPRG